MERIYQDTALTGYKTKLERRALLFTEQPDTDGYCLTHSVMVATCPNNRVELHVWGRRASPGSQTRIKGAHANNEDLSGGLAGEGLPDCKNE